MTVAGLTAFWIKTPYPLAPLGFGVTARCLDNALRIIRVLGYGRYIPNDPSAIQVVTGVTVAQLDQPHVVANMGPIVVRGMWYPFVAVGMPVWADAESGAAADRPRE